MTAEDEQQDIAQKMTTLALESAQRSEVSALGVGQVLEYYIGDQDVGAEGVRALQPVQGANEQDGGVLRFIRRPDTERLVLTLRGRYSEVRKD